LYCRVEGEGEPAIVFVHGTSVDNSIWDAQVEHFRARHRVVAPDLRGHGQSDPAPSYPMDLFRDDLAAIIEQLELAPAVVIGQASGAEIANRVAVDCPGLVRAVVFVDYGAARKSEAAPWAPSPDEVRARANSLAGDWKEAGARRMVDEDLPEEVAEALKARMTEVARRTDPNVVRAVLTASLDSRAREEYLQRLAVPTLILQSTAGKHQGRQQGQFIHERVPGSQLAYFEGRGHWFFLTAPQEFSHQIEQLLATL
jgi:pimeloyl-ACP methyl ester carboxylesterase